MDITNEPLTAGAAQLILATIPHVRLQNYLDRALEGPEHSARLYLWNSYMAAVVQRSTGLVEVQLRNAIDMGLRRWNTMHGGRPEWIVNPVGPLTAVVRPAAGRPLRSYAETASVSGDPTHDDLVAGLSFGSWVRLLPRPGATSGNPRTVLWNEALKSALGAGTEPVTAYGSRLRRLVNVRNRAAHHRPLLEVRLLNDAHRDCVEVLRQLNGPLARWFRAEKWIPKAIAEMPTTR